MVDHNNDRPPESHQSDTQTCELGMIAASYMSVASMAVNCNVAGPKHAMYRAMKNRERTKRTRIFEGNMRLVGSDCMTHTNAHNANPSL